MKLDYIIMGVSVEVMISLYVTGVTWIIIYDRVSIHVQTLLNKDGSGRDLGTMTDTCISISVSIVVLLEW